jgi:hypothetical protein
MVAATLWQPGRCVITAYGHESEAACTEPCISHMRMSQMGEKPAPAWLQPCRQSHAPALHAANMHH